MPLRLEFTDDNDGGLPRADMATTATPAPSTGTTSTTAPSTGTTSTHPPRDKDNLKRGQHGRHQQTKKKVHAIHRLGPNGEPVSPKKFFGTYSNQCACAVKEKVHITYLD
jgi:hypothetical protein